MIRQRRRNIATDGATARKSAPADRSGAAVVEMAVVIPVFFLFMFAFIEFGHAFMTIHIMNAAANKAARLGVGDNVTTAQVRNLAEEIVDSSFDIDPSLILVKDGSIFDQEGVDPSTIEYSGLPNIEVSEAETRQLFIVRIEVPYSDIAIFAPKWLSGITIRGMSVQRHE